MKKCTLLFGFLLTGFVVNSQNIYTADGNLTADRTMTMSGKNLTFNPTAANSQFFINGLNGNIGIGISTPTVKLDVNGSTKTKTLWATNTATAATSFATDLEYFNNANVFGAGYEMFNSNPTGSTRRMLNFYDLHSWSNQIPTNDDFFVLNIVDRGNIERLSFSGNKAGGPSNGRSSILRPIFQQQNHLN